ncbi:MFS transporter [Planctomycetota bacterium]
MRGRLYERQPEDARGGSSLPGAGTRGKGQLDIWKHTGRFCLAAFFMDLALGMYMVAIPFLSMSLGAESKILGYLGATRGLSYGLSCLAVAFFLLERYKRLTLIAFGCLTTILMFWATALSGELWHLFPVAIFWGMAVSLFWPALFAWMGGTHSNEKLGTAIGVVNLGWSAGIMAGAFIGGILFKIAPWIPFAVATIPAAVAYAIMLFSPREKPAEKEETSDGQERSGSKAKLAAAWLGCLSMSCLTGLMMSVFPRLGTDMGIDVSKFGFLVSIAGTGRTIMFALSMVKGSVFRDWRFSAVAQAAAVVMVATICRAESYWWMGCVYAVLGVTFASTYYRSLYTSLEGAGSKGFRGAVHEAVLFAGILIGSVGGGELADRLNLRSPYVPIAGFVLLLNAVQIVLALKARKKG